MWRHGDIIIAAVDAVPVEAKKHHSVVLAQGELTGHHHRLEDSSAGEIWLNRNLTFLRIAADWARVIHEEHAPITLPRGTYRFWQQREYSPTAIRTVRD